MNLLPSPSPDGYLEKQEEVGIVVKGAVMHIIIGFLTALAGLIWALYRLQSAGVDLNAFNPFYWIRRRRWAKQYGTKPLHQIHKPLEAAATLVVAVATLEKDMTRDLRTEIVELFQKEFKLSEQKAFEVCQSSSFLLRDAGSLEAEVKHILAPSKDQFNRSQVESLLEMLNVSAQFEAPITESQRRLLQIIRKELDPVMQ